MIQEAETDAIAPLVTLRRTRTVQRKALESRAYSLSLINFALCSFFYYVDHWFPFPLVERWNCMELYVCHELSFVSDSIKAGVSLRRIGPT